MDWLPVRVSLFLLLLLLVLTCGSTTADNSYDERRTQVGVKLFRSLLAADMDLTDKLTADGKALLYFAYRYDSDTAQAASEILLNNDLTSIRKTAIVTRTMALADLLEPDAKASVPAGIFITERMTAEDLRGLVDYGIRHHIVVYSAFEGDVEKGVLAGVSIQARIKPYINIKTLNRSRLNIKPFFMKISRQYD